MGGSSVETEAEPLDIETADMSRVTSGQECRRELEKKKKKTEKSTALLIPNTTTSYLLWAVQIYAKKKSHLPAVLLLAGVCQFVTERVRQNPKKKQWQRAKQEDTITDTSHGDMVRTPQKIIIHATK